MYWKLFLRHLEERLGGSGRGFLRSGMVTGVIVGLLVLGSVLAYLEHGRGNIHKLKTHLEAPTEEVTPPQPGGEDAIVLTRSRVPGGVMPEFLSATLLPGRGMDVLQITAYLPEKGEVNLLDSEALASATKAMSGVDEDAQGQANLTRGGPILAPWAGRLSGLVSNDGKSVAVTWRGRIFNVPANRVESGSPEAYGGLLLKAAAREQSVDSLPDGETASATFANGDYEGRWPSQSETKVTVLLSGRSVGVSVDVKNVGEQAMPVGVGWAPRLLIPSGDRSQATLHIPSAWRIGEQGGDGDGHGRRTEALIPVAGTRYDFTERKGVALGNVTLDDTFVHPTAPYDQSPVVELRDPAAKFGYRMTLVSPTTKAVHVYAPPGAEYVTISPQMNYDDPFGRRWGAVEDTGMAILQPGQTVRWEIRLELFPLTDAAVLPF
jgi:aldose 1-epimerase